MRSAFGGGNGAGPAGGPAGGSAAPRTPAPARHMLSMRGTQALVALPIMLATFALGLQARTDCCTWGTHPHCSLPCSQLMTDAWSDSARSVTTEHSPLASHMQMSSSLTLTSCTTKATPLVI